MEQNEKIVIYQTADGQTRIDVKLENDTVWLSQSQMAELFQKDQSVIAQHTVPHLGNQVLNARCSHAYDSREPYGRDGHDGQGYCQSH